MNDSLPDTRGGLLPVGFKASGVACGIKADPSTLDVALFVADAPVAAEMPTTMVRVIAMISSREPVRAAERISGVTT